jgi:CBS domain-containing protein
MKVFDLMTPDVECTRPTATLREVAERMSSLNVGSLPVCEGDVLLGIVTDRDITVRATAAGLGAEEATVQEVMTPEAICCYSDQEVAEAVHLMECHQVRRMLVKDRDQHLVGILTLGDLAVRAEPDGLAAEALEVVSEPAMPSR